jgi:hypothetical protein
MNDLMNQIPTPLNQGALEQLVTSLNSALESYSDKDWNYSRISLTVKLLSDLESAYFLWPEVLDLNTKPGKDDLRSLFDEVKWGEHHSSELGVLEIISLRINKALLECTRNEFWQNQRLVLRVVDRHLLADKGVAYAFWYDVLEVAGEDFENR